MTYTAMEWYRRANDAALGGGADITPDPAIGPDPAIIEEGIDLAIEAIETAPKDLIDQYKRGIEAMDDEHDFWEAFPDGEV